VKHFTHSEACVCVANFSMSLFCFLATSCTQQFPTDTMVLVVDHHVVCRCARCGAVFRFARCGVSWCWRSAHRARCGLSWHPK